MLDAQEGQVTYFGFEKFETGSIAADAFQIKTVKHLNPLDRSWSDARLRGEFDTLQLYDNDGTPRVRVPRKFGDTEGQPLEHVTEAYPEFDDGRAVQLNADKANIKFKRVDILPEG